MAFRRGFKAEANRIALRARSKLGLAAIDPLDPMALCAAFDIELIPLSALRLDVTRFLGADRSVFSAVTVPCGLKTAIVHNDAHHWYRQRSNICHELAHSFLGHEHTPPLTEGGTRAHDSGLEAEANFLGGALLITNEAAVHIALNGLELDARGLYGVSQQMLDFRLRVSGARTIQSRSIANRRKAMLVR